MDIYDYRCQLCDNGSLMQLLNNDGSCQLVIESSNVVAVILAIALLLLLATIQFIIMSIYCCLMKREKKFAKEIRHQLYDGRFVSY